MGGPGGHIKPPLWSLTNIKCVAADVTCVRPTFCAVRPTFCAVGRHFAWCGRHLLAQDSFFPFFENFLKCFGLFQGEKYTFFQKFSKIGLVAKKLIYQASFYRLCLSHDLFHHDTIPM